MAEPSHRASEPRQILRIWKMGQPKAAWSADVVENAHGSGGRFGALQRWRYAKDETFRCVALAASSAMRAPIVGEMLPFSALKARAELDAGLHPMARLGVRLEFYNGDPFRTITYTFRSFSWTCQTPLQPQGVTKRSPALSSTASPPSGTTVTLPVVM